ncbi:MAG: hypothetical protein RDU13_12035 [Elusimicrobiales bacterium]|jgi:aspartate kinase|nr:hypothetical protein [Elusimicrobiales bacterium]
MKTLVMKFGGTSLADPGKIRLAAGRVKAARRAGFAVAAVVSAPGDVTDELLALAAETASGTPARELDALLSCGELMSAALLASALEGMGIAAVSLTGAQAGFLTDSSFGSARVREVSPARLKKELASGRVAVVCGFQGADRRGNITTLGRGGSDLTAVELAHALKAESCELLTDVKGVYSANPSLVPEARKVPAMTYAELERLARFGTEVRQLRAVRRAARLGVRLHIRSAFHSEKGTMVSDRAPGRRVCVSLHKGPHGPEAAAVASGAEISVLEAAALRAGAASFRREAGTLLIRPGKTGVSDFLKRLHSELAAGGLIR